MWSLYSFLCRASYHLYATIILPLPSNFDIFYFFFCLTFLSCFALFLPYICQLGAEEDENPEIPVCTDQKSPNKSQLSRAKGPGKGHPSKIENVWMAASTLARHHRKNYGIIQTHA